MRTLVIVILLSLGLNAQIMRHHTAGGAGGPTEIASDDFNRGTGLGANWTQLNSGWGSIGVIGDTAVDGGTNADLQNCASAVWAGSGTFSNDQYSSLTIYGQAWQSNGYHMGVIVRASTDTGADRDFYFMTISANAGSSPYTGTLGKVVNGTYTQLNQGNVSITNGDEIKLSVSGTDLEVYVNDVQLTGDWEVSDSDLSTGKPGVIGGGSGVNYGDNWSGGNI